MTRRKFGAGLGAAVAGMTTVVATTRVMAEEKGAKHVCRGRNECKGLGGCKTAKNDCAGKNECKGLGGCATVAHHDCAGKNECKGLGGCKTAKNDCAGMNECKGLGGCAVPLKKQSLRVRRFQRTHA